MCQWHKSSNAQLTIWILLVVRALTVRKRVGREAEAEGGDSGSVCGAAAASGCALARGEGFKEGRCPPAPRALPPCQTASGGSSGRSSLSLPPHIIFPHIKDHSLMWNETLNRGSGQTVSKLLCQCELSYAVIADWRHMHFHLRSFLSFLLLHNCTDETTLLKAGGFCQINDSQPTTKTLNCSL